MTRKHFEAIADVLSHTRKSYKVMDGDDVSTQAIDDVSRELAATLGRFNPAFNRDKFLKACGVM